MVIGDKCVLVNHPFYNGRYGRIIDVDIHTGRYKVTVDIDNKSVWVPWNQAEPAKEESEYYYDEHYRKMKVQPILLAQDLLTPEQLEGALLFNIIKYSVRAGEKEGEPADKDKTKKDRYKEWLELVRQGKRIEV